MGVSFKALAIFCCCVYTLSAAAAPRDCDFGAFLKTLTENHISSPPIDDVFSERVYKNLFKTLDPDGLYFDSADILQTHAFKFQLDDALKNNSCEFLRQITHLYRKKLLAVDSLIRLLASAPLNYERNDFASFSFFSDTLYFPPGPEELASAWEKQLAWSVLGFLFFNEESGDKLWFDAAEFEKKESEARESVSQRETCRIGKILDHPMGYENYVAALFKKAVAAAFDPHSDYLSEYEMRAFETSLSKNAFSFGLSIDHNFKGDIEIFEVIPGGPAWRSGELKEGDVILNIRFDGDKHFDFNCATLYEAQEMLNSIAVENVELTVRKSNGQISVVPLIKEKIEIKENVIQSYILEGGTKVGFIVLPGFYADWDQSYRGMAQDIARALLSMKQAQVEGLILDLRFNGGGAVTEALDLAGVFIDYGNITVMKGRDGHAEYLKDMNRGTIYDGPLVVMVNGLSASASEIFAAAMQDYNRAVIVGERTFGKATGQIILPVGDKGKQGFVKTTVERFYRLRGDSHQFAGVTPDIRLPDIYSDFPATEARLDYALATDKLDKPAYWRPFAALPLQELSERSARRRSENDRFETELITKRIFSERRKIRLNAAGFKEDFGAYISDLEQLEKPFTTPTTLFEVKSANTSPAASVLEEEAAGYILKDAYVEEAYLIIADLININNSQ